jgi:hypothetical protein
VHLVLLVAQAVRRAAVVPPVVPVAHSAVVVRRVAAVVRPAVLRVAPRRKPT